MFDLGIIIRVFTSPNSAFAEIRDNENKYFAQSIALLVFTSLIGLILTIPFLLIPYNLENVEGSGDFGFPSNEFETVLFIVGDLVIGFTATVLLYFIGK